MKSINLQNSNDLKMLQNEMNSIFEKRISTAELNESVKAIETLSFGDLKNIFESISDKLFETKKGKSLIKKYVKAIKENKALSTYYVICESIQHPKNIKDSFMFLSESLSLANIDKKSLKEGVESVADIIKLAVFESNISKECLEQTINNCRSLNESIDYVLTNKESLKNIREFTDKKHTLSQYIQEHNVIKENTESQNAKTLFNDLNESLFNNGLESWENRALMDIAICNLSNGSKKDLFEQYKNNCLTSIDKIMENADLEDVSRFSTMREQLLQKEYFEENLNEDILKLSKLNHTLSE